MSDKFDAILRKLHIEHWKAIAAILVIFDVFAVNFAYLFSLWIRFDCRLNLIPEEYLTPFIIKLQLRCCASEHIPQPFGDER